MGSTKSRLQPAVIADLEGTTAFSSTEICQLYRQFLHDSDGKLGMNCEQFTKMYIEIFPRGEAITFAEHVFRTFDTDKNGTVNFRNFLMALSIQLKGTPEEKINWAFDLCDIKGNGHIDFEEAVELIRTVQAIGSGNIPREDQISPEEIVLHIFKKGNKEKDTHINRQDFTKGAMTSKTLQCILQSATKAAGSPFTRRKARSGSFGMKPRTSSFAQTRPRGASESAVKPRGHTISSLG